ncbi:MAG: CRISPR-associated endonuclease Cas1, partial [Bacteroidota bacterium]|nr:CRISPR-associated endonuclease Cas1 [Bacteroidota bacterium]
FAKIHQAFFSDTKTAHNQLEAMNNAIAGNIVSKFICGKIKNQRNLVKYFSKYSKRNSEVITEFKNTVVTKLTEQINKLRKLAAKNLSELQSGLFMLEAQAAGAYWNFIRYLISPYISFPGRHHQNATDLTNQLLNYGYGILYSRIWEALIKARLDPNIGYLHANAPDRPALVFDFIEEFRPQAVDRVVVALINKKQGILKTKVNRLTEPTRKLIAQKVTERLNRPEKFRGKEMNLTEIINFQATQVAKYINGTIPTYKPYIAKW